MTATKTEIKKLARVRCTRCGLVAADSMVRPRAKSEQFGDCVNAKACARRVAHNEAAKAP